MIKIFLLFLLTLSVSSSLAYADRDYESAGDKMVRDAREMTLDAASDIEPAPGNDEECYNEDTFDDKLSDVCAPNTYDQFQPPPIQVPDVNNEEARQMHQHKE